MKRRTIICIFGVALFTSTGLALIGCGGADKPPPGDAIADALDGAPDWVTKSCSVYWRKDKDKQICGVGSAGGSANVSLMRTTAIGRGRTEIARSLQTWVGAMLRDYASTTTGGEDFGSAANDEQHIAESAKQITDTTLSGTEMVDSWIAKDGTYYALVALDVARFNEVVSKMGALSEKTRAAIVERAEEEFGKLDEEIEKQRAAQ